ncbi:MAG: peptidase [Actinomycetota bacterium]|nr:peptidase [Actinomycetota bacterium]
MSVSSRAEARGYAAPAALVAVLTLIAILFLPDAALADPPTEPLTTDPADAAAGWLSGELVDGQYLTSSFDADSNGTIDPATEVSPDPGLTADAVLAFAAAGSAGDAADAATNWLESQVATYTGDGSTESYAGPLAKLILVADVMGRDATDFGGQDLLARLGAQQSPDGRFSDISAFGDFSSPISQSLVIIALNRASPDGFPPAAVDFLIGVQCADGGYVSDLSVLPCATGEVDATALAAQALLVAGRDEEASDAGAFLTGQQADDGSLGTAGAANSNSTGVAVPALRALGDAEAADQAAEWLLSLQAGPDEPAEQRGAFSFDAGGFDLLTATRATPQAVLGVAGIELSELEAPSDPAAYGLGTQDGAAEAGTTGEDAAAGEESGGGRSVGVWLGVIVGVLALVVIAVLIRRSRTSRASPKP